MTSCGRLVACASAMIGSDGGRGGQDRAGLADLVEVLEQRGLDRRGPRRSPRPRGRRPRGRRARWCRCSRPSTSALPLLGACRAGSPCRSERSMVATDAVDLVLASGRRTARRTPPWRRPRRCRWPSCRCRRRRPAGCRGAAAACRRRVGVCVVGDHDRAVGRLVGVEAAAGLAAEQAGGDHLLEDRRRRVQPVAALLVHRVEDLVRRVEADQVEQRQRAHRVAAAEAHRGVDVLAGGVAGPRTSTTAWLR